VIKFTAVLRLDPEFFKGICIWEKLVIDSVGREAFQGYYWESLAQKTKTGPFATVQKAFDDYCLMVRQARGDKQEQVAPLIRVDFKNKKRIF
jgi:hypothetical protein